MNESYLQAIKYLVGFPSGSEVNYPPASTRALGLIPGVGRSPREGKAAHSSIHAWRIPWTEELGGLQSVVWQRVGHD